MPWTPRPNGGPCRIRTARRFMSTWESVSPPRWPTMCPTVEVWLQSENGMLGIGPFRMKMKWMPT